MKVQENDIPFRLDTGAQCNVTPQIICKEKGFVVDGRRWSKLSPSYSSHELMLKDKVKNELCWMEGLASPQLSNPSSGSNQFL